ncbi:hypothetical protein HYH02_000232 [Chlamydomonas schloesseri]|uniref:Uncharacterized protein n=1 Tax=Chlamydomonas schloesseri TaxID=2026947 RepID=A0A836B885_9CHLO|nr:hypothetical protein HYH02_000232 [Chlamydomonas schloesseri]|eukprot:KAG2450129.1 hypothetical protein HYH02_000232 [Chlamydomonas schloesseri]
MDRGPILQFKVDDVAASPSLADAWAAVPPTPNASGQDPTAPAQRAYSRAVCLSFGGNSAAATPAAKPAFKEEGSLELKVQQLVADFTLPAAAQQLHTVLLLEQLAAHLRSAGLVAQVLSPPRPDQRSPLTTRSIRDPFLVVSAESLSSDVDGASDVSKEVETVIVDPALFAHLALAPATPAYLRTLRSVLPGPVSASAAAGVAASAGALPAFTVVARSRLVSLVKSLAPAVSLNFSSQGMEVPPWRRTPALLRRWEPAEKLEQRLALAARLAAEGDDTADASGTLLWGSAASSPASPVVPVFGFTVVAETASAWATPAAAEEEVFGPAAAAAAAATPAVLASLFRRVSSTNSEASASDAGSAAASDAGHSTDSEDEEEEELIYGLSPISLSGLIDQAAAEAAAECGGFEAIKPKA